MSYQYQQYPQYFQPPQTPAGPGAGVIPPQGDVSTPPAYTPLPSGLTLAEMQSAQLTAIAAGQGLAELGVKAPDAPPADFPFLMYKQDGTTKAAKDDKEKADLASKGYSENPPKQDPYALTSQMLQDLQLVWSKAGDTLTQLMQLVQQQQMQMQAAGNILGAGQQQPQSPYQQPPQAPAPSYPSGD